MKREDWLKTRPGYRAFGVDKQDAEESADEAQAEEVDDVTVEPIVEEESAEDLPTIQA